jgi:hypothetical protein
LKEGQALSSVSGKLRTLVEENDKTIANILALILKGAGWYDLAAYRGVGGDWLTGDLYHSLCGSVHALAVESQQVIPIEI